jgi:hypothetical protein
VGVCEDVGIVIEGQVGSHGWDHMSRDCSIRVKLYHQPC